MEDTAKRAESSRRTFLKSLLQWSVAIALSAFLYPLLRFTGFKVKPKPRYIVIRKDIPVGGSYTEHDFILFVTEKGPVAISRHCTHLGCRVNYRQELGMIECPCHQSRFTLTGKRVAGPAEKNLALYSVRVLKDENGKINGYEVTI